MKSRTTITIVLAVIMIIIIMGVALIMTLSASVEAEKYSTKQTLSKDIPGVLYLKLIDLTGDGEKDLFIQTQTAFKVMDTQGNELFARDFSHVIQFTFNDLDSDGVDDIVIYYNSDANSYITVFSKGEEIYTREFANNTEAARVSVIQSSNAPLFVTGDTSGRVTALSIAGDVLWQTSLGMGSTIRGMEDATISRTRVVVAADIAGNVAAYTVDGDVVWEYHLSEDLRHLRAYDLDGDGTTEIFIGGDETALVELDGATGTEKLNRSMGQPITRIGEAELNGDPSSREFYVGGKDGGMWAFDSAGHQMWSGSVGDKVTAIDNYDIDDNGLEEIFIGDENGDLNIFSAKQGSRKKILSQPGEIVRMDNAKINGIRQLAVAGTSMVQIVDINQHSASLVFRYTPIFVGLVISVIIIIVAWLIASVPQKPPLKMTIGDQSVEGLQARRRMLKETIADVERLKNAGEIHPDAYLARLKDLRAQLAEAETALLKAGVVIKPETLQCPKCGGILPLGIDKCDYCGQVVIK